MLIIAKMLNCENSEKIALYFYLCCSFSVYAVIMQLCCKVQYKTDYNAICEETFYNTLKNASMHYFNTQDSDAQ